MHIVITTEDAEDIIRQHLNDKFKASFDVDVTHTPEDGVCITAELIEPPLFKTEEE